MKTNTNGGTEGIFFVYILECKSKNGHVTLYTGYTNNLERRVEEHASGKGARHTKGKKCELVFFQTFPTQQEAMQRELEIKSFSTAKKRELLKDICYNELLHRF